LILLRKFPLIFWKFILFIDLFQFHSSDKFFSILFCCCCQDSENARIIAAREMFVEKTVDVLIQKNGLSPALTFAIPIPRASVLSVLEAIVGASCEATSPCIVLKLLICLEF
jgi:hypothetical protein